MSGTAVRADPVACWERLESRSPSVELVHTRARHEPWILTDTAGGPFEQDGWRDGESIREWMSGRFREELSRRSLPHLIVTGAHKDRMAAATGAINALISEGWSFSDPLTPLVHQ
ncbi:MAG: putative NadR-like transcriptional regulator [Streptosporangiaceae bacterium]|nr:putative NadR-like transcriptional regulator [Streptosporangiaceae bacterium]